ncbi:hypothetical protein [Neptuniibacter sp. UBA6509]|uniref:hypothetical protein n=1 Tax=Neptuniibacter sp. UBA6509 TaxID=1946976 RepID=UPI0025D4894A|nr:hypothetical protein [Neptuniibacter sp. UBA6509]|tara:strand:+ start:135 stop:317 length:183 start_codon:yes stop_codon:yes gene_type:complete
MMDQHYSETASNANNIPVQIGDHTFPTPPLSKEEEAGSPSTTPTFTEGEYWWANEFGWEQ